MEDIESDRVGCSCRELATDCLAFLNLSNRLVDFSDRPKGIVLRRNLERNGSEKGLGNGLACSSQPRGLAASLWWN